MAYTVFASPQYTDKERRLITRFFNRAKKQRKVPATAKLTTIYIPIDGQSLNAEWQSKRKRGTFYIARPDAPPLVWNGLTKDTA